jgi:GNAT superfamily N-acetyltransferase
MFRKDVCLSRQILILPVSPDDAGLLAEICVAAKGYWGYSQEWMTKWSELLRVTPEYIHDNLVFKALVEGEAAGWYALAGTGDVMVLDHLWVRPEHIRQGIGRALFYHALQTAANLDAKKLEIESDPNARGFYEKLGAKFVRYVHSSMERELPYLEISIQN